jgi:hypothetical protein
MENQNTKGGPKTDEGKAVSRYNAIKHGLLTKEVLVDKEEMNDLAELTESINKALDPMGPLEKLLVDRIVSNVWRLRRALVVETNTMEWYQNDFDMFPMGENEDQQTRKRIRNMVSNDNIDNILRYETTIERSIFRALHELERLQAKRNGKDIPVPSMVDVNLDSSFRKNDQ